MSYVLDTNAVAALMRGTAAFLDRLERTPRNDVTLPGPVMAEVAYGIQRLPRSRKRDELGEQFRRICAELPRALWTDAVSEQFGVIKAALERRGDRIEDFDVAIAAHALAVGAILVTANVGNMARVPGLTVEDWAADKA